MHAAHIIGLIVLAFLYFLPTFVASRRAHRQADAIFALNVLGGWTVVGWIIAMVWAFTVVPSPQAPLEPNARSVNHPTPPANNVFDRLRQWPPMGGAPR